MKVTIRKFTGLASEDLVFLSKIKSRSHADKLSNSYVLQATEVKTKSPTGQQNQLYLSKGNTETQVI